ncbi:MAG TPA: hypothetical protein VJU61_14880, partial [Polyangiaceae bacterium]|nr:hypothetical protein [Polyangiaceae bacterium]
MLAERRIERGESAELALLLEDVLHPPVERIGALEMNDFMGPKDRKAFAAALNTLLASPTFASWRQGATLDVQQWLTPQAGRTPAVI